MKFLMFIGLEVGSIIAATRAFGGWIVIGGLAAGVFLGVGLLKRTGWAIAFQAALGAKPDAALRDGARWALAAALLMVPGFCSDALAVLLLFPGLGAIVFDRFVARWLPQTGSDGRFQGGTQSVRFVYFGRGFGTGPDRDFGPREVRDVTPIRVEKLPHEPAE